MWKFKNLIRKLSGTAANYGDMEESINADVESLLNGKALDKDKMVIDIKDNTGSFVPRVKESVTYIVAAVLFNDRGEVLMVQEAKSSCRGKWYLPAGRMEANETIEEAAQREVLEESGFTFQPTDLLFVEVPGAGYWYRFTLTGHITGGLLKAYNAGDTESLQAQWYSVDDITSIVDLRAQDIVKLVQIAFKHRAASIPPHNVRPIVTSHCKLLARIVLISATDNREQLQVLAGLRHQAHLPTVGMGRLMFSISRLTQTVFTAGEMNPRVLGVLAVEHDGRPTHEHDGLCLTLLVTLDLPANSLTFTDSSAFSWVTISRPDVAQLLRRCIDTQAVLPECRWI